MSERGEARARAMLERDTRELGEAIERLKWAFRDAHGDDAIEAAEDVGELARRVTRSAERWVALAGDD